MKALFILALSLALEVGFLFHVALVAQAAEPTPAVAATRS